MVNLKKMRSDARKRALEVLELPKNEPLRWLLGGALHQHAEMNGRHFLLEALASERTGTLMAWNADIHEFRPLLENPETAPQKAEQDLRSGGSDAEDKLLSLAAEIMAVIKLSRMGYKRFRVLLPSQLPTPDFEAEDPGGKLTSIEVKNLREPEDIVRTVAFTHWKKKSAAAPDRYNFKAVLSHSHRGALSSNAVNRLRSIIDILPDARRPFDETLDGGVHVRVEKADEYARQVGEQDPIFAQFRGRSKPGLMVVSGVTSEHLVTDVSEIQSLFLKTLRRVVDSVPKFFGESFTPESGRINLIALRWEPPDSLVNEGIMEYVQTRIAKLFVDFQLPLRVVIFTDPEIGLDLMRQYS